MPTDSSSVQITINVVDANSGTVISNVVKGLNQFGDAGIANGRKVATGFKEAGAAGQAFAANLKGVSSSVRTFGSDLDRVAAGLGSWGNQSLEMDRIAKSLGNAGKSVKDLGGHAASSLDGVRLLSQEFGLKLPRALESMLSRIPAVTTAIKGMVGGFAALAGVEVLVRLGQEVYELWQNYISLNSAADKYYATLKKSREEDFSRPTDIETGKARFAQSTNQAQLLQQRAQKLSRDADFDLNPITQVGDKLKAHDLSVQAATATQQRDQGANANLDLDHQLLLQQIEKNHAMDAELQGQKKINAEKQKAIDLNAENNRYDVAAERSRGNVVAPNAGAAMLALKNQQAIEKARADADVAARNSRQQTLKLEADAQTARLRGEDRYYAEVQEQERVLLVKYQETELSKQDYIRQRGALEEKYAQDRLKRLDQERAETERLKLEANTGGLTGLAKVDATRDAKIAGIQKEAPNFSDPATAAEREGAARQEAQSEAVREQQQFNDRLAQIDAGRADHFESESQRIADTGKRTVTEITKAWTEEYGQLAAMDQRRVQSYQALQDEIRKINADTVEQQRRARQQLEDETIKSERQGARGGGNPEREKTQAILDEYADRYQHLEELRQQDAANADLYRRQEIAAEQEKNNKLLDQQRELRDKLASQLKGFFNNPLEELKRQGEEAASKIAATFILKATQPRGAGAAGQPQTGATGGIGDLFGLGGLLNRRSATPGQHGAGSSIASTSTTLSASTATIYVQTATFAGGGGGGSSSGGFGGSAGGRFGLPSFGSAGASSSGSASSDSSFINSPFLGTGPGTGFAPGAAASSPFINAPSLTGPNSTTRSAGSFFGGGSTNPGIGSSIASGIGAVPGALNSANQFGKELGAAGSITDKVPGLSKLGGGTSGAAGGADGSGIFAKGGSLGGTISGGLGVLGAVMGKGGIGGALQGALGGAQLGAQFGGPIGAAIGAVGGAIVGLIGFGARAKAADYDRKQVQPRIAADLLAFEAGSADYQSTYGDLNNLEVEAQKTTKGFGSGAAGYFNDTIKGEINTALQRLTREQKSGRSQFGMTAAQFHGGGPLDSFGSMATSTDEGWFHGKKGEVVMHEQASLAHGPALGMMLAGATHNDMASYYGGGSSTKAPAMSGGGSVNLNFHSHDAKGAYQLFMDNKHHIRTALNSSYEENSGGADFA